MIQAKTINKELLRLAVPNILSNISVPLLSSVDTALMGHESIKHLGAVGIGAMIFNFLYWNFGFLRMGTTGFTAQAFGAKDKTEIISTLFRALFLSVLIALLLILAAPLIGAVATKLMFVQDNQSLSKKGILRGLHFQKPPHAQGKLVRVIKGKVLDVIVDIRKSSPTYGEHMKVELSEENFTMLWVPPGFAHGFLTLSEDTIFAYKCTDFYAPESEEGLMWNDAGLAIDWGVSDPSLSDKDKVHQSFADFKSPFE